jgi:2,4-dienoyl-CoA reductase-like NADH-dependent reductase (Old Yellow Enzyme family)
VTTGLTSARYAHALSPVAIGATECRNRVFVPAHTVHYGIDHHVSDRHIAYYRERALGGAGLIITEGGAVHPSQRGPFDDALIAYDKAGISRYRQLAATLHELGTKVFVQLFGIGVHTRGTRVIDDWVPVWGPSAVPSVLFREVPMVIEQTEIDELVHGFAESAANLAEAGIDGAELHAAHSYLLAQFLSPTYNKRTDDYGGSRENRARLTLDAARAVRDEVGRAFTLGIRLSFDELIGDAGITPADSEWFLDRFAGSGLFDFFDISGGGYHSIHRSVSPMNVEDGHMIDFGRRAKAVVGDRAKVLIVGRITDLDLAERIVADGSADLVGMARAHMADPFVVAKAIAGRAQDTVRCVGANECFNTGGRQIACMMNPVMGRERRWGHGTLQPAAQPRRVAVVGGGPAGMKTAAVAASRGHAVTLYESTPTLGGQLNLIKRMPTRSGWQRAIDNLTRPLEVERVDIQLEREMTAESFSRWGFDAIVVATGATWVSTGFSPFRPERDAMPGYEAENVLGIGEAARRAIEDPHALGASVVIIDETGAYLPVGLAELLADAGAAVEVMTPLPVVGEQLAATSDLPFVYPRLFAKGVRLTTQSMPECFDGARLEVSHVWSGERTERAVDTVVFSTLRTPSDAIYQQLRSQSVDVRRVGDALAPRSVAAIIYEAEEFGRAL